MFLSWLTPPPTTIRRKAWESALSSQNVRFAHNRKAQSGITLQP
jgi:hypothetical protein